MAGEFGVAVPNFVPHRMSYGGSTLLRNWIALLAAKIARKPSLTCVDATVISTPQFTEWVVSHFVVAA
jgi:hypothetical protein